MSSQAYDLYTGPDPRLADGNPTRLGQIDRSVRAPVLFFFTVSVLWLLVGSLFGVISAIKLHAPQFLGSYECLTFGIARSVHLNVVMFGWGSNAIYGVSLWLMHRLCRTELPNTWVPLAGGVLWNVTLFFGLGGIMAGAMTSVEWLEMPKEVGPPLSIAFLMIGLWNVVAFARRKSEHVYVSQWYILAAVFWFPLLYCVAEMMILWYPARGTVQAIVNWWFGHNALGLWLTPMGVAAMYYFIPKVIGKPIHSYYLSIVGFWTFALFYNWAGVHHLIGGPIPVWMQSAGIVASVMMVIPVLVTAINFHYTTVGRENWRIIAGSPTLRFVIFGAFNYTLSSLGGSLMALREVNATTHFTNAVIGHAHHGMYAFLSMVLFGSMYFIMPRLLYREWPSASLIRWHFWLCAVGIVGYVVVMTIHGVMQGVEINTGMDYKNAGDTLGIAARSLPWTGMRTLFGTLMTLGHVAFAVNFFRMLAGTEDSPLQDRPTLLSRNNAGVARMKNLPLIFCGVFATIAFSWTGLILTSQIQVGHLTPYVGPKGGVPGADTIRYPEPTPKGGAIAAGKDEYIRLGCLYCHSQQVRPAELFAPGEGDIARGWGPRATVARDYITQERVLLGTMRTGPDLANVGARTSPDWHYQHFFDPTLTSPGSNMAPFAFLYEKVELASGQPVPTRAIKLPQEYRKAHDIPANVQFVPTERLDNLVAYLMSLRIEGDLPESRIKD